ncbi:MAG: hypothetical protein ACOX2F_09380 [bacterium]
MKLRVVLLNLLVLTMIFAGCGSSKKNVDNETSDKEGNDLEAISDDDGKLTNDNDKENSDKNLTGDDDKEIDDSDFESHICNPNPCKTEKNIAEHRTRCMPADNGTSYTCECDVDYHSSGELCCQAYSNSVDGECVCNPFYVVPHYDSEKCVPECSENTIEGLNGYCEEGKICQQGTCITDHCADYECPENSTCTTKNDAPFCQCNDGLTMSDGKCCPVNSTNKNGECVCNDGYEMKNDECVPLASNKCHPNPCVKSDQPLHKNTCVLDDSEKGYHCECNENYIAHGNNCVIAEYELCPAGLQCLGGYCVPFDLSNEQCITDDDCHEFPGAESFCYSPHAAGGVCMGCSVPSDCPGNTQCMDNGYGTCALMCDDDNDCPYGKCYANGYCGQKRCYTNDDCFGGTLCIDSTGTGHGMCQRISCKETKCSKTNPGGSCEDQTASCIGGECVNSCTPNPCKETNRGTCEIKLGVPTCVCDEGTSEKSGKCEPVVVAKCPTGFNCISSYCTNKSDAGFVCNENKDCGGSLTCSPTLPSGSCSGCTYPADCPGGAEVFDCMSGYCLKKCLTDYDCNDQMECKTSGYCGKKDCSKNSDCAPGYSCSSGGVCNRTPCK